MTLSARSDIPVASLSFHTAIVDKSGEDQSGALLEVCRLQMSIAHIKSMVDVLSKSIDYYPNKQEAVKKKASRRRAAKPKKKSTKSK